MEAYHDGKRRRRRGLPSAKNAAQAPDLFNMPAKRSVTEPRARRGDRATSHRAAGVAASGDLSATQAHVLVVIGQWVGSHGYGITDDQLVVEFGKYVAEHGGTVRQVSPQRIRTVRADLVALKLVRDSGQLAPSALGNDSTAWEPAPAL